MSTKNSRMSREKLKLVRAARKELADSQMWARIYTFYAQGALERVARARAALAKARGEA